MAISLIPPEVESTDVLRSVVDYTESLPEDQMRAHLAAFHSPAVDEARAQIKQLRTSQLFGLFGNPGALAQMVVASPSEDPTIPVAAVMMAVADEIDRRIPVPK